jgi:hypothetical protein
MAPLAPIARRIVVGVSAAVVLGVGALLKPAAPDAPPPSTEAPAPMLQQVVQQREAETIYRRMREAWPGVARFTARVARAAPEPDLLEFGPPDPAQTAERFGVVVGSRRILADVSDAVEGASLNVVLGDGRAFEARVITPFPDRSLAILEAPDGIALEGPERATSVVAGMPIFAAAARRDGTVIAPLFVAHASRRELSTTNALDAFRGMAVFNLEGQLAGILAYERGQVRVLTMGAALEPPPPPLPEPRPPTDPR